MTESYHGGDLVCFESVTSPGQHIGILPSGEPKPPANTGKGVNGAFYPVFVDEVQFVRMCGVVCPCQCDIVQTPLPLIVHGFQVLNLVLSVENNVVFSFLMLCFLLENNAA